MAFDVVTYVLAKNASKKYTDEAVSEIKPPFVNKGAVQTVNDLPLTGNNRGDAYLVKDEEKMYTWTVDASSGSASDWSPAGLVSVDDLTDSELQELISVVD